RCIRAKQRCEAFMQYLADSVPDRQLLAPVNSISRYKTIEWLNYIATELHKGISNCKSLPADPVLILQSIVHIL
ncbi:hypothetical protein PUR50_32020, partial [Enterobacter hormaechei subsp. steigerwaltii]|nr:hypothetical protein [Enterobacter hormaechei subsp. steigerwaltii]